MNQLPPLLLRCLSALWVAALAPAAPAQDPGEREGRPADRAPADLEAAKLRYEEGEQDEACQAFEALSGNPENLLAIARYLCFEKQDFARGESFARRCPQEVPGTESLHPLMTLLLLTGESAELEKLSRAQLEESPDDHGILFYLGLSCTRQNKTLESIAIFERLVEREPENLSYCYALGDAYLKGRREAEAEVQFRKVLQLDPANKEAVWRLGDVLAILGRDAEAEEVFKDGIQRNNLEAAYRYGVFLFQRDRFQEALFYFKRWTKEKPDRAMPWAYLGRCHLQLGRKRSADAALERFRELRVKVDTEENEELSRMLRMRRGGGAESEAGDAGDGDHREA